MTTGIPSFDERYTLESTLGQGAMGVVYAGVRKEDSLPVAVKVLQPEVAANDEMRQRFVREATALSTLRHPNVIGVLEFGELGNTCFLVMEFLEGETLNVRLERGAMPPDELLRTAAQVADAIDFAHRHGVIHRDLKPGNILVREVDDRPQPKVIDFGIAKATGAALTDRTVYTGFAQLVGTPLYMSPEQGRGDAVDWRSDIYSLGATFYHMVTGQLPFTGMDAVSVMRKHATEALVAPRVRRPSLPLGVNLVILRMMEKATAARYQQPAQLIRDLDAILAGQAPPTFRAMMEKGPVGAPNSDGSAKAAKFPILKRYRR